MIYVLTGDHGYTYAMYQHSPGLRPRYYAAGGFKDIYERLAEVCRWAREGE